MTSSANYELGHIPGAVLIDWRKDIMTPEMKNKIKSLIRKS